MKKQFLFSLALLFIGLMQTHAVNRTLDNGLSFSGDWIGDAIVINDNSTTYDVYMTPSGTYSSWKTSGDLDTVAGTLSATHVKIVSTGPGKGRLTYYYTKSGCGQQTASIDVYKHFNPNVSPYNIDISGPDCILEGDTVVYSINPILTKHLTQGIGVDEYFWNITDTSPEHKLPFVDKLIYDAGDGSSITFVAGSVSGQDTIKVQVGIANVNHLVIKPLGKAAPKPAINPICIPYGASSVQVSVAQPVENVIYSWTCNDDEWGFKPHTGSVVTLIPGNTSSPDITVTAYYEGGEVCSASKTTIKVSRSWSNNVEVTSDTVPYKFGHEYNFSVIGGTTGGGLIWTPPTGWTITEYSGKQVTMRPEISNSVKLYDSLFVEAALTCAAPGVDRRKYYVYVKPAKVTEITDNGCLIADTTYKFKIIDLEPGPKATTYKWLVDNIEQSSYTGDSLIWQAVSGKQTISVIPRGAMYDGVNYYWGDTATFSLTFQPIKPDSIISSDTCLFSQKAIETTLYVHTPIPGQTYHWTSIPGWNMSYESQNPNDSSIVTYSCTSAFEGEYPIFVTASGLGDCSLSSSTGYSIKVDTIEWEIAYQYSWWSKRYEILLTYQGNVPEDLVTADWYVNGSTTPETTQVLSKPQLPQTLRAVFTIGECDFDISLNNGLSAPQRKTTSLMELPELTLFPNPAHHQLLAHWDQEGKFTISIIDTEGKIIMTEHVVGRNANVNISSIPDGHYIVIIRGGKYYSSRQLIIKH